MAVSKAPTMAVSKNKLSFCRSCGIVIIETNK